MRGEWKVTSNTLNGTTMYGVYRIKDTSAVDHSGNREYATDYTEDREQAIKIAEELNQKGGQA